jgi:hypothetical protein
VDSVTWKALDLPLYEDNRIYGSEMLKLWLPAGTSMEDIPEPAEDCASGNGFPSIVQRLRSSDLSDSKPVALGGIDTDHLSWREAKLEPIS